MLLVTLKWSKTLQFGERKHVVPLVSIPGSELCPVSAFKLLCERVPGNPRDPLARVKKGKKWGPLPYRTFQNRIRTLIMQTGRNGQAYSTHSLRRGGASYLSAAGVSREMIKLTGDWKSDAVDHYIQFPLEAKVTVSQKVREKILQEAGLS